MKKVPFCLLTSTNIPLIITIYIFGTSFLTQAVEGRKEKTPIYIGGFFPIGGHPAFVSLPHTVQTAINHVNSLPGILDDYELRMRWNWTSVSQSYLFSSTYIFFCRFIFCRKAILAIL